MQLSALFKIRIRIILVTPNDGHDDVLYARRVRTYAPLSRFLLRLLNHTLLYPSTRASNTIKDIQSGDAAHIIERKARNTVEGKITNL